jgi:signal transduction histidine kinase
MSIKHFSVVTVVTAALVSVTTFLVGIFAVIYFLSMHSQEEARLRTNLTNSVEQLSWGLSLPVWNFDLPQIRKIMESQMEERSIYAIVVKAGGNTYGIGRDDHWNVITTDGSVMGEDLASEERVIIAGNETIGSVRVYLTPRFLKQDLYRAMGNLAAAILLLDLILVVSLYLLLWRIILKPLRTIEHYVMDVDAEDGKFPALPDVHFQRELENVRCSIRNMIALLDVRHTELRQTNERLQAEMEERIQKEEALRASEARIKSIGDHFTDGMIYQIVIAPDGTRKFTYLSDSVRKLYGVSPEEGMADANTIYARVYDEDIASFKEAEDKAMQIFSSFKVETRIKDPSGELRWSSFISSPKRLDDGSISWDGIEFITTERKRAEEALKEQARLQELLMNISTKYINMPLETVESSIGVSLGELAEFVGADRALIFDYDFDQRVARSTHEWCREGVTPEIDNNQMIPFAAIPDFDLDAHRRGEPVWIEDVLSLPPGPSRDLHLNRGNKSFLAVPLMNSGECVGFVGFTWTRQTHTFSGNEQSPLTIFAHMLVNIRQRKQTQEQTHHQQMQLIQADKMASLGVLVSGIAHEINNPNNLVMFNGDLAARLMKDLLPILDEYYAVHAEERIGGLSYAETRAELLNLLNGISIGAHRIRDIVANLKDFARVDAGTMNQELHLNTILNSALLIVGNLVRKSTEAFSVEYGDDLPVTFGNAQQIEQVMINLITNSCHALKNKAQAIRIHTAFQRAEGKILVVVSDEGSGISPKDMKRLFDPFFTTKRNMGGTGLGLSISYSIVQAHKGELKVQSVEEKGTTVTLSLPVISPEVRS